MHDIHELLNNKDKEIDRLKKETGKLKNLLHFYTMGDPTYKEYNKYLRSMGLDTEVINE